MKLIGSVFLIAALGYGAVCLLLFLRQRDMLFYPTPARSAASVDAHLLRLQSDGETLRVWRVGDSSERALIYFGGNAEDVALNCTSFKQLFPGWTVYLPNYRGYGGSSGTPSERGLFADALALYDHVRQHHPDVAVMGRSLGSGVGVFLAAQREVDRLVLVTPFDSMAHLAATYYPWVPVQLLLRDRFDSRSRAGSLTMPTLVLIGEQDEVVPAAVSASLVAALPAETTSVETIEGAGHNTIGSSPHYERALARFLAQ
ncbi:MAG: alpha/beta fold hydrolase [Desulfofustis sp.]|jgi:pimeloyl-ACP methyl ester carboxylesterase|nr:alpha/beta fold hydrolase [Desulfofustis sp.]